MIISWIWIDKSRVSGFAFLNQYDLKMQASDLEAVKKSLGYACTGID